MNDDSFPKQPSKGSGVGDNSPKSGEAASQSQNLASTSHDGDHVLDKKVCGVFSFENPVSGMSVYQQFGNLQSQRCHAGGAIGVGDNADLLNTEEKRNVFRSTLTSAEQSFFDALVASQKHSFAGFTQDQARATLLHVYNNLDSTGRAIYLSMDMTQVDEGTLESILQSWDPAYHLLLTEETQCQTMFGFTENLMTVFCLRFAEPEVSVMTFLATVERCGYCVGLGIKNREDETMIGVLSGEKCEVYMDKVRQFKPADWDVYYLMWCPSAVTPRDIDRITTTNLCNEAQLARLKKSEFTSKLKQGVLRSIGIKLIDCFGSIDTWTTQHVSEYASYVTFMPREIVVGLQLQKAVDNFDVFAAVPNILDSGFLRVMGYKVADWWTANQASLDSATKSKIICLVVKFAPNKDLTSLISVSDFQTALETGCPDVELTVDDATGIVREITKDGGFTWGTSELSALASFIGGLTAKEILDIPNNVLCDNWATVKSADVGETELAYIWDKCGASTFANPDTYDCDKLKEIGNLLAALPLSDFVQIPQAVLATCLGDIAPVLEPLCRWRRPGVCKEVMTMVAAHATANSGSIGTYIQQIGPELTRAVAADLSTLEITDLGGWDNLENIDFSRNKELASAIWKKVKDAKGAVTRENVNYCGADFMKVSKLFFVAANELEWKNLCEDENILDVIGHAATILDKLNGRVIKAIIDKGLKIFGAEDENVKGICIEGPMIKQAAAFLPYADGHDLAKFNKNTLKAMLVEVGKQFDVLKRLPRGQMRFITKLTLEVMGLLTSTISDDKMTQTGPFVFCGMMSADIDKLTENTIKTFGKELMQCTQLDLDAMIKLVSKFKSFTDSVGPSVIEEYGPMIIIALSEMSTSDLTTDMKKLLAANVPRLMKAVNEFIHELEHKDDREVSAAEKARIRILVNEQLARLYTILLEVETPAARRKRSTAAGDCSILSSFEGNVAFLTAAQISALGTTDLMGCLPQLADTMWSSEQCTELRAHLVHASGLGATTSSWAKVDVQALGTLVDCLQAGDVQVLQVDDTVINALGDVVLEKDADVITAYFAETSTSASNLTSGILSNFGNMVCGLSAIEIGNIPSAVVHASASDLGTVSCMDQSQLEAIANQILAEEGSDWSSKEPAVVDKFGIFVAGFSETVLKTFDSEHVKEISSDAIGAMPPATLAGAFTAEDFEAMSADQSNAITEAQLNQLDADQKAKVNENSNYVVDVDISNLDGDNGCTRMGISALTVLVTLMTTYLL